MYFFSDNIIEELLETEGNLKVSPQMRLDLVDKFCGKNFILAGFLYKPDLTERKSAYERYGELQKPWYKGLRNRIHQRQIETDKLDDC